MYVPDYKQNGTTLRIRIPGPVDPGTDVKIEICCAENQRYSGYAGESRLRTMLEFMDAVIDDAGFEYHATRLPD